MSFRTHNHRTSEALGYTSVSSIAYAIEAKSFLDVGLRIRREDNKPSLPRGAAGSEDRMRGSLA